MGTKEALRCYWETRPNIKGEQHAPTRNNQRPKYMRKKKEKKKRKILSFRILAVIVRYGPHLMIVMIFVTQNNF